MQTFGVGVSQVESLCDTVMTKWSSGLSLSSLQPIPPQSSPPLPSVLIELVQWADTLSHSLRIPVVRPPNVAIEWEGIFLQSGAKSIPECLKFPASGQPEASCLMKPDRGFH